MIIPGRIFRTRVVRGMNPTMNLRQITSEMLELGYRRTRLLRVNGNLWTNLHSNVLAGLTDADREVLDDPERGYI